jgi:phage terminase large subunit-like protein
VTALDDGVAMLALLVLESGHRWGEVADAVQWEDARAVLDVHSPTPYHWLGRARGYSKTADLGAVALAAMLVQLPAASMLYALAADRDQGRLQVDSISGFTLRTPELAGAVTVDAYKVKAARSGSVLEVLPADAAGAWGLRPAFLVVDELPQWAATSGPRLLYDAVMSALGKVPGARAVVLTSAGDPSHWAYKEREHARVDPLWRLHEVAGPAPWTPHDRLEEQRRRLLPSMYARLFDNVWTESEDRLTTLADVQACVGHIGDLEPDSRYRYVVTLDVGLVNDRTAAVVAHAEERAPGLTVVVDRLALWSGTRAEPVDLAAVEAWVEAACVDYSASLVFDPYQAQHLAQRLRSRGVSVLQFSFSSSSISRLAVTMFGLLRDHCLDLPDIDSLVAEIANVRLRETGPGVVRMDHDSGAHDDQAIAVALAAAHMTERSLAVTGTSLETMRTMRPRNRGTAHLPSPRRLTTGRHR